MRRKILSLLLAAAMVFSLSVTVHAEETEEKTMDGQIVILHTNDVHGAIAGYAKVAALKDAYEAKGAYVLLMDAGDFIQGDPTVSVSEGATAVELMNLAGYDLAVPGNHEYIGGDVDAKAGYLRQGGVCLLRDSVVSVDGGNLYIAGRDDRSNPRRKPLADLLAPLDSAKPVVVLDHQPVRLSEAEDCGVQLQLSGHTHEGQFFPVNLVVRAMYENAYGYSRRGGTQYYVSSGLGLWGPPYRIGTQSELLVIRLRY